MVYLIAFVVIHISLSVYAYDTTVRMECKTADTDVIGFQGKPIPDIGEWQFDGHCGTLDSLDAKINGLHKICITKDQENKNYNFTGRFRFQAMQKEFPSYVNIYFVFPDGTGHTFQPHVCPGSVYYHPFVESCDKQRKLTKCFPSPFCVTVTHSIWRSYVKHNKTLRVDVILRNEDKITTGFRCKTTLTFSVIKQIAVKIEATSPGESNSTLDPTLDEGGYNFDLTALKRAQEFQIFVQRHSIKKLSKKTIY